jgi:hypothetical protein
MASDRGESTLVLLTVPANASNAQRLKHTYPLRQYPGTIDPSLGYWYFQASVHLSLPVGSAGS